MNNLIIKGNDLFKNCGFMYYVCGGFALELFAGKTMRTHSDLDVSVFHENKKDVATLLLNDGWSVYKRVFEPGSMGGLTPVTDANDSKLDEIWVIWAIKPGSHLVPKLREGETDIYDFEILAHEQNDFNFVEIVLDHRDGNNYVCGKGKNIKLELNKAILYRDGVPYMAPELVLFLKSPQVYSTHELHKEKTPGDFKTIVPLLPDESRDWLLNALATTYPDGYEWLDGLLVI